MTGNIITPSEARRIGKAKKLSETLALFPVLPDEALVDINFVSALKSRSTASLWRDVKSGALAKPVNAGPRCTRWKVGDLRSEV